MDCTLPYCHIAILLTQKLPVHPHPREHTQCQLTVYTQQQARPQGAGNRYTTMQMLKYNF